uniref:acetyl-CoA acetyltransferase n=1 Tax=uncultured Erythrobacter sp. TaxID=263913 RepID=UPI002617A78B|nr:acetyl-CoA acetyltransferase [uncultured Erythrobacter sp.]
MVADNTPVIIGVGQYSERVGKPGYEALSYMDLAGRALAAAIVDAEAADDIAAEVDTICAIRQFEISYPGAFAPFGHSDNPPRSIAKRVGADPRRAILEVTGGQANQKMVGELASDIALGESDMAVIVGSEAISTVRRLVQEGQSPDWSEEVGGQLEDRGYGLERYTEAGVLEHSGTRPVEGYALNENARRARLGLSLEEYRLEIGRLFAPFTEVAAKNSHAAAPVARTAEELAEVTERNRIIAEPYPRMVVSRDQVNQGAAVIIASAAKARALGVPEANWVHIHAVSAAQEMPTMQRPDLARSEAAERSLDIALGRAGKFADDIGHFDFYSCFAVPVFNVIEHLLIEPDDPRGLTLTGGLPFFGGAGNNYSTHAIAEAVHRVREDRGAFALVGANGGVMGKYATGIYSTQPADWSSNDRYMVVPMSRKRESYSTDPFDACTVESYTIAMLKKGPRIIFVGRNERGERVVGNGDFDHEPTRTLFEGGEPFGAKLAVTRNERGLNIGRVA